MIFLHVFPAGFIFPWNDQNQSNKQFNFNPQHGELKVATRSVLFIKLRKSMNAIYTDFKC